MDQLKMNRSLPVCITKTPKRFFECINNALLYEMASVGE